MGRKEEMVGNACGDILGVSEGGDDGNPPGELEGISLVESEGT